MLGTFMNLNRISHTHLCRRFWSRVKDQDSVTKCNMLASIKGLSKYERSHITPTIKLCNSKTYHCLQLLFRWSNSNVSMRGKYLCIRIHNQSLFNISYCTNNFITRDNWTQSLVNNAESGAEDLIKGCTSLNLGCFEFPSNSNIMDSLVETKTLDWRIRYKIKERKVICHVN